MDATAFQGQISPRYDVLIQGAGIGGLTLAIALQQRGYVVRIVERSASLSEVGAGIWMAANPMQVFDRLGFSAKIMDAGWIVKFLHLQDSKSGEIQTTDMSAIAKKAISAFGSIAAPSCSVRGRGVAAAGTVPTITRQTNLRMTAVLILLGNSAAGIPESDKRCRVNGLRESFGVIGAPIRLSMRAGGESLRSQETAQVVSLAPPDAFARA